MESNVSASRAAKRLQENDFGVKGASLGRGVPSGTTCSEGVIVRVGTQLAVGVSGYAPEHDHPLRVAGDRGQRCVIGPPAPWARSYGLSMGMGIEDAYEKAQGLEPLGFV